MRRPAVAIGWRKYVPPSQALAIRTSDSNRNSASPARAALLFRALPSASLGLGEWRHLSAR
jgi:hypothetical protein